MKRWAVAMAFALLLMPSLAHAQTDQFGLNALKEKTTGLLQDPANVFPATYTNIINFMVAIVAVIAVVLVLNAGTQIMTAFGNEEKIAGAKKTLMYVAIGVAVVIFAFVIIELVTTFIRTKKL